MNPRETNLDRRKFLTTAAAGVGSIGVVATAIPFLESMQPSEAAKAAGAPLEIDISKVAPGALLTVEWRGKPIWILHRTDRMLELLNTNPDKLLDPQSERSDQPAYAKNASRSIKPAYLIATAICTHLGCIPIYRPDVAPADIGQDWTGGFYCPCHGSKFDLAGRVFKNVPAPRNLDIPPHAYVSETRVLIGEERKSA